MESISSLYSTYVQKFIATLLYYPKEKEQVWGTCALLFRNRQSYWTIVTAFALVTLTGSSFHFLDIDSIS